MKVTEAQAVVNEAFAKHGGKFTVTGPHTKIGWKNFCVATVDGSELEACLVGLLAAVHNFFGKPSLPIEMLADPRVTVCPGMRLPAMNDRHEVWSPETPGIVRLDYPETETHFPRSPIFCQYVVILYARCVCDDCEETRYVERVMES